MKAIANVSQPFFDKIWDGDPRFVSMEAPDMTGRDIEIRAPGYNRYITGLATEYEDGVLTIEIFARVQ